MYVRRYICSYAFMEMYVCVWVHRHNVYIHVHGIHVEKERERERERERQRERDRERERACVKELEIQPTTCECLTSSLHHFNSSKMTLHIPHTFKLQRTLDSDAYLSPAAEAEASKGLCRRI